MEEEGRVLCHLEEYRFDYCRVVLLPALRALSNWEFEGTDDVVSFARGEYIVAESSSYLDIYSLGSVINFVFGHNMLQRSMYADKEKNGP